MKKFKSIEIFNFVMFFAILIADFCYMKIDTSEYITKTIVSGLFVLLGAVNLIYTLDNKNLGHKAYRIVMFVGLCFAFLGDILLIDYFVLGVTFFALGHVFYLTSFLTEQKISFVDLLISLVIFVCSACVILLYKGFKFEGAMQLIILIYALIISCMLGKSLGNLIKQQNKKSFLIATGALAFFLSDLVLLFRIFANAGQIFSDICVIFYYPAQFILAFSIYYITTNKGENKNESI